MRKPVRLLVTVLFLTYLLILVGAVRCSAQGIIDLTPDCCLQVSAVQGQVTTLTSQLRDTRTVLDSTRMVSARIIGRADTKIRGLERDVKTLTADVDTLNAQLETLPVITAERDQLRGRTWVGRGLRKVRDGLAYFGGAVLVVSGVAVGLR